MKRTVSALAASLAFALALTGASARQKEQPPVLESVVPFYPPIAKAARAGGLVSVEVWIDAEGRVRAAEASGHPLLAQAAKESALRWRFSAAHFNTQQTLVFDFRLAPSKDEQRPESPFHVVITRAAAPDTVSHIPEDHEGRTCKVHGFKLEKDKVNIVYGLMISDPEGYEAAKSFPHANRRVEGGCEVSDDSPKFAEVLYCRACRAAEDDWKQKREAGQVKDTSEGARKISAPSPEGRLERR